LGIADVLHEHDRLKEVYGRLRLKLLDLSKKNRMLNYSLGSRSKRHMQIVDEVIDEAYKKLVGEEATLRIDPLEEPEDIPSEEKTEEFTAALEHAKVSHLEYLTKLEALESAGRDDEPELVKLERELRDHIRQEFGLPPRLKKAELNRAEHARSIGIDPNFELGPIKTKPSHSDTALQTLKFPDELDRIMGKIVADARLSEQEMGISTLFLSFGFLEWYESDVSDKKAFAPLLLLPVKIEVRKQYGKNVYSLSASEGSAETNLSLQKLLETNTAFHRKLPAFESGDEEGVGSIEEYFQGVREAVQGLDRWQIHRWMVLGHFAFGRFAVYSDLNPDNWAEDPVDHSLVGAILQGTDRTGEGAVLLGDPADYVIDDPQIEAAAPFLIHDADASQHSALIDAMKGHNLVIHGPPGTGKSQTIANIIANAMAADKTVLFVAEKQAALEVVKRRLERAGLGDFCLELHSEKASPKAVLDSLNRRLRMQPVAAPSAPGRSLHENRIEITRYLDALHTAQPSGRTAFDLIWRALRGAAPDTEAVKALAEVRLPNELLNNPSDLSDVEAGLGRFADASDTFLRSFGHAAESPWTKAGAQNVDRGQADQLLDHLRQIERAAQSLSSCISDYSDFDIGALADLRAVVNACEAIVKRPPPDLVGVISQLDRDQLLKDLEARRALKMVESSLAAHPSIGTPSADVLEVAIGLGNLSLQEIFFENTPAALIAISKETVKSSLRLKSAIDEFFPVLELFKLDGKCSAGSLDSVARAIIASTKISPEHRFAIYLNQNVDVTAFETLFKRWSDLIANESEWRRNLSVYGKDVWPESSALRGASELLRKGNFSRAFAAISGAAKPARELVARLGLANSKDPAAQLTALANHVEAIEQFETDDEAARLLGTSWLGLETKFPLIDFGIRARKYLADHAGREMAFRLFQIPQESTGRLHSFEASATKLRTEIAARPGELTDRSVDITRETLNCEIAVMGRVAAADPHGLLKAFEIPVRELSIVAKLEIERRSIWKLLADSPLKNDMERIAVSAEGIDKAFAALEWLKAMSEIEIPASLDRRLRSPVVAEEFARLRTLTEQASEPLRTYDGNVKALNSKFGLPDRSGSEPDLVAKEVRSLLDREQELPEFLGLSRERRHLNSLGLGEFLEFADRERIAPLRLPRLLDAILARRGAALARRSAEALQHNTGSSLETRRKQFAEKDRSKIRDDRLCIKAKLLRKRPFSGSDFGRRRTWTEMALIGNEIGKQKGFVPVRTLLAQAGKSVQALKPCFMMSPLSLAKFMKAGALGFDMLVIDEASQMRPEDALGALLRSKQIVVVGDQKQLPPTDFFSRSGDGGAGDDEDIDDLDDESILESCQKTFGQRRPLRWHYRSRCESLIRFSNEQFYGRELITFPASKPASFSIDLVRVPGTFQARCNPVEASRVAEEAITFMRHHADRNENEIPSLGIVALNIQQRDLIQQELNRLVADDVLVDQYREKVANKGEELFVKNLENVQGDERDFIFISMTYGPESGSAVLKQRFGPINRKQGHRRLNVLFSRARTRIGLFCSFGSADIKPASDSAEGVHVLRKYLEYAETRGREATTPGSDIEPDSDFEIEVADRLRARSYLVDYQVGVSGYKIDLGIRHPDFPERYLAGIECDGAAYHSSKSARDRDRLREEVLNNKGWDIVRVWSTDWFENPTLQTDRLVEKLELLRQKPAMGQTDYAIATETLQSIGQAIELELPVADSPIEPVVPGETLPPGSSAETPPVGGGTLTEAECFDALRRLRDQVIAVEMADWEPHRSLLRDAMIETFVRQRFTDPDEWFDKVPGYLRQGTNPAEKGRLERVCDIVGRLIDGTEIERRVPSVPPGHKARAPDSEWGASTPDADDAEPSKRNGNEYLPTNFPLLGIRPDPSRFYDREYEPVLRSMVESAVRREAPIYEDVLVDRIARAHGFQRSGDRIQKAISRVLGRKYRKTHEDGRAVIWAENSHEATPVLYRESRPEVRSHADTPIAELASLALPFIRVRLGDEDILYRMANHFQLGRLREPTRIRFQSAIDLARRSLAINGTVGSK
jgi:very-short-patch-repair endonuclease